MKVVFNYFERLKNYKKNVFFMLAKMIMKWMKAKANKENQVANLLVKKMNLEELAKEHVEDKTK